MSGEHDLATPQGLGRGDGAAAGKSCVLVVDDESGLRRLVVRMLQDEGYAVLEAADGAQALALLEADAAPIDLVLTDIRMPRLSGLELGRRIAMLQRPLPVIYMSADPPVALVDSSAGIGTPSCLQKPFSVPALVAAVDRLLGGPSGTHAAVERSLASA